MKKTFVLIVLLLANFGAFATNPASDFEYKLSDNMEYVMITGLKNDRKLYDIPATIEEFPVRQIGKLHFKGSQNYSEITIKLPQGATNFSLNYDLTDFNTRIVIEQLPNSLEKVEIVDDRKMSLTSRFIKVKGNLNLPNLKEVILNGVDLEQKSIQLKNGYSVICNTNVEELIFEEGISDVGRDITGYLVLFPRLRETFNLYNDSFVANKNLKKVVFPTTLKSIGYKSFDKCSNISEIVIPESVEHIDISLSEMSDVNTYTTYWGYGNSQINFYSRNSPEDIFDLTSVPLKTQAQLTKLLKSN